LRKTLLIAALAGGGIAMPVLAQAQGVTTSFRGFRAEGNVGWDRFQSQGTHDDGVGFGGTVGWDGAINDRFVVGPEFSYWRSRRENVTTLPGDQGTVAHKSFNELNASVRVGMLVNPRLLVYAKGGYANGEQRKALIAPPGQTGYYNHFRTSGYTAGGGAEYALTDRFYVNAEYRYTGYNTHNSRQRVSLGAGVRF